MRRGKRPAAGGTGPGLPGPVAWAVGTSHHPASEKASVAPNPPGLGRPSGCGSRRDPGAQLGDKRGTSFRVWLQRSSGQAGGAARCRCGAPVWRRCVRRRELGAQNGYIKGCSPPRAGGVGSAYGSPTRL